MRHFFHLSLLSIACTTAFAADPIHLQNQTHSFLNSLVQQNQMKEVSRHVDLNHTTHIRFQQTFENHLVWGADGILHVPQNNNASLQHINANATMNGTVYLNLAKDLANTSINTFNQLHQQKILQHAEQLFRAKNNITKIDNRYAKADLIVYVDKQNKAHWAYLISFAANPKNETLAIPTYILDANTFAVYEEWNNLQTLDAVTAGGFGGNPKLGKRVYDGNDGNFPAFHIERNKSICTLENDNVVVHDDTHSNGPFDVGPIAKFNCDAPNADHHVYWNGDSDATNGGYSPVNDSFYIGDVVRNLYLDWYHVPVLSIYGQEMQLGMHAHAKDLWGQPMDNAFFFPLTLSMYFGDGVKYFYPLTSLGVGAHELSHGFTSQHSNLTYEKQSGGLNESYSDMAAQAAEFYSAGKNSWQIGPEIVKGDGALRYMDDPTKDGKSIAHIKDYTDELNVHYSSGIFNKVFYTLGTSDGWNTRKAFDVMVKANMDYWTANSTFADAACGVMHATKDLHYNTDAVVHALSVVGLDASHC